MSASRPAKLSHAETILYEIDMLRYAAAKLSRDKWETVLDKWACLEDFLVHFRNLIEFFGRPGPRPDDLSITKPDALWSDASTRPPDGELKKLWTTELWDKYEGNQPDKISKYLHHCTERRVDPIEWEVGAMFGEIAPTLEAFENALPNKTRSWWQAPPSIATYSMLSASTASPKILSAAVLTDPFGDPFDTERK